MSRKATKGKGGNLRSYNRKILGQIFPDMGINSRAATMANNLVHSLLLRIANSANSLLASSGQKTFTARTVQAAVGMVLHGEIGKLGNVEAVKAVTKYNASVAGREPPPQRSSPLRASSQVPSVSSAARAGLVMRPTRIKRIVLPYLVVKRTAPNAMVYLAAIAEFIIAEIFELAYRLTREDNKYRVRSKDIMRAIREDAELSKCFPEKSYVLGGGVISRINPALLKGKAAEAAEATEMTF